MFACTALSKPLHPTSRRAHPLQRSHFSALDQPHPNFSAPALHKEQKESLLGKSNYIRSKNADVSACEGSYCSSKGSSRSPDPIIGSASFGYHLVAPNHLTRDSTPLYSLRIICLTLFIVFRRCCESLGFTVSSRGVLQLHPSALQSLRRRPNRLLGGALAALLQPFCWDWRNNRQIFDQSSTVWRQHLSAIL